MLGRNKAEQPQHRGSARSESTRKKIVRVAEKLFAERGIDGVSLNDINKAAGQRNKNATHYHFGSKDGLLQAILDKHEPGIAQRQEELLDQYEAQGELTVRNCLRAIVLPLAEKLQDEDGGREYIRFTGQMVVGRTMHAMNLGEFGLNLIPMDRLVAALGGVTSDLPDPLKLQRGILIGVLLTHSLAEHSRMLEGGQTMGWAANTELFIANLEDSLTAILEVTPSQDTLDALP